MLVSLEGEEPIVEGIGGRREGGGICAGKGGGEHETPQRSRSVGGRGKGGDERKIQSTVHFGQEARGTGFLSFSDRVESLLKPKWLKVHWTERNIV